jgi:pilus assembly protein Flp/PilA
MSDKEERSMLGYLNRLFTRDEGATMVEYGLMVALIAVVALLAVTALGGSVRDIFQNVADTLTP